MVVVVVVVGRKGGRGGDCGRGGSAGERAQHKAAYGCAMGFLFSLLSGIWNGLVQEKDFVWEMQSATYQILCKHWSHLTTLSRFMHCAVMTKQ